MNTYFQEVDRRDTRTATLTRFGLVCRAVVTTTHCYTSFCWAAVADFDAAPAMSTSPVVRIPTFIL